MACENYNYVIPEKYRDMSIEELEQEEERLYLECQLNKSSTEVVKKKMTDEEYRRFFRVKK